MVESQDKEEEVQTTPVTREKWCHLESETGAAAEIKVRRLALGKVGKGDKDDNNDHNNNDNNNREETPLAERAVVAKAIVRSLDEGEGAAEVGLEAGPSNNR